MFNDKTILITGGTGSFGKAFTKIILERYNFKKIIIYSRDEYKQFVMRNEIASAYPIEILDKLRFFIGDIRDKDRLYRALNGVNYVVHAAAMKQVPACEYNPFEAIKTNIHGAQNVIDAALDCKVDKVVALSTDKAVNPINLYGGTKLVSDKLFIAANAYKGINYPTTFSVVRYGNVAGSRGSIIPFFRELLNNGATELPITDFRMTRFWITLNQGVDLVIKAITESKGGETYISKIPSFRIVDLAKAMGGNDIALKEIGIREGEKLYEVMITKDDSRHTIEYQNHYIIYPEFDWCNIDMYLIGSGTTVEDGFEYNSKTNTEWLEIEQLKALCRE